MTNSENVEEVIYTEANGDNEKNKIIGGVLYLVALPIGNLADTSARALKVLSKVDKVAAEDTRNTAKLLMHFEIRASLISYHEHNKKECGAYILEGLKKGESWALVTDAGTPGISDPGEDMVKLCAENGITVTLIPGACALVNAVVLSGLPARRFVYEGFLEGKTSDKKAILEDLKYEKRTLIFYEAPHRLKETLDLVYGILGDRKISLCREITKINEEIMRTTLSKAIEYYSSSEPRGEYVLVVSGADEASDSFWKDMSITEHVNYYISLGLSKMDAVKAVARDRKVGKSIIYKEFVD